MTATLYANTELVAMSWLGSVFTQAMVGTTLPEDNSTWAASGFVQAYSVGGAANTEVPVIASVVSVDTWAVRPGSNQAPFGHANNLMETIRHAAYKARPKRITLAGQYPDANFKTAYFTSEPRRIPDASGYAHYNAALCINWTPVTL